MNTDNINLKIDEFGTFLLPTRRTTRKFTGEDAQFFSKCHAIALSKFYAGSGRFIVSMITEFRFKIEFDECQQRIGVEEPDLHFEAWQHSNSGTVTWNEARTFNIQDNY